jgi:hypothetical protein
MPRKGRSRKTVELGNVTNVKGPAKVEPEWRGDTRPLKDFVRRNFPMDSALRKVVENLPDHLEPYELPLFIRIVWPLIKDESG